MEATRFRNLVTQMAQPQPEQRLAARMLLLSLQEDAVNPLIDVYYAGVTDTEGVAILSLLAEIGGWEAMNVLRSIFEFETERTILKRAAASGLLHNADNLSQHERESIALFLAQLTQE